MIDDVGDEMKVAFFSICILLGLLSGLVVVSCCTDFSSSTDSLGNGCTACSVPTDSLGNISGHVILDGNLSESEAAYFKDYEFTEDFDSGNGGPRTSRLSGRIMVEKFIFAVGNDGIYFFETMRNETIEDYSPYKPGWMHIKNYCLAENYFRLGFYDGTAYHKICVEESGVYKGMIPRDAYYDIDAKKVMNSDGSVSVEGISYDEDLVHAMHGLGSDILIRGNAGEYRGNITDILLIE